MRNTKAYELGGPSRSRITAALEALADQTEDQPQGYTLPKRSDLDLSMHWEIRKVAPVSKAHLEAIERQKVYDAKQAARDEGNR